MEKRAFRVLVPQEFHQVYYVTASSEEEAIDLVHLGPREARARGVKIKWCESEFVSSMEPETWEVEELEPRDHQTQPISLPETESAILPEGLTRDTARFLAHTLTESWDPDDCLHLVIQTMTEEYLANPDEFFEQWNEWFDSPPTDPRKAATQFLSWLELQTPQGPEAGQQQEAKERLTKLADRIIETLDSLPAEHTGSAIRAAEILVAARDLPEQRSSSVNWERLRLAHNEAREALGTACMPEPEIERRQEKKTEQGL